MCLFCVCYVQTNHVATFAAVTVGLLQFEVAWFVTFMSKGKQLEASWNVMAHARKPDFVFRRNGRVYLNRRGRQFSRLLAAEACVSAVVMLDTPCSEVVWRVLATHSFHQFPLHLPSRASPCAITFQPESIRRIGGSWGLHLYNVSQFKTVIPGASPHKITSKGVWILLCLSHYKPTGGLQRLTRILLTDGCYQVSFIWKSAPPPFGGYPVRLDPYARP